MTLENPHFQYEIHGGFPIVMLVFGGVDSKGIQGPPKHVGPPWDPNPTPYTAPIKSPL